MPSPTQPPRYAPNIPLPPYAYVPGHGLPHPVNDSGGHSYGHMPHSASLPPDAPATPAAPAASKPAKKPVATKAAKPSKKPAAKKKAAAGDVNKSDEVRKLATAMKAKGTKPRPSVIVAELGAKGITVAAAQVSIVLKKMGFRPLRKRKKKGAAEGAPKPVTGKVAARGTAGAVSIDDLLAAKKAVAALGGTERAMEAIQALRRLEG